MEIFVYNQGSARVEEGFTVEQLPELLKEKNSVIWVDMNAPTDEDDRILLDVFKFHPLAVEDCRADRHHPKVEEFPDHLYVIVHGVRADVSPERFNTIEFDGFLGQNYVVTYHHENFSSIDAIKQKLRASPVACQRGAAYLFHQILDHMIDLYIPVLDNFDDRINKLEDDIFALTGPDTTILEEIFNLKRSILRLRRISGKQLDILYRISHGEFSIIESQLLPFYRDIYDHLVRVVDMAENYRDLVGGALDAYLSVVSNRTNDIMKVLTIFSATLLPMTFIAGVYGMNFENMPELRTSYGYFIVLALMLFVATGMMGFFWWKGWIGPRRR